MERAQGGDANAFGELVGRHEQAMFAVARAYLACEADIQDAVQGAFVRAFRAIDQLSDSTRFRAWMARITARTCLDALRSKTAKVSLADFATTVELFPRVGEPCMTPASLASLNERSDYLKAALGRLPEEQRVVLLLRYLEDMSYDDIAAYLDVPSSTVRGRLHNAKVALKRILRKLETTGV